VINNHKNDRNGVKIIDISTDIKLIEILRKGIGKYVILNQMGNCISHPVLLQNYSLNTLIIHHMIFAKLLVQNVSKMET